MTKNRWLATAAGPKGVGLFALTFCGLYLSGCTSGGFWSGLFHGSGGGASGANGGGSGAGVPGVWDSVAGSIVRLDWWLGLGAGISILVGVYHGVIGEFRKAVVAVGFGIALLVVNAVVAVLLPAAFLIASIVTAILAVVVVYRVWTGKGLGGHSLRCLVARLRGLPDPHAETADTDGADLAEVTEPTP